MGCTNMHRALVRSQVLSKFDTTTLNRTDPTQTRLGGCPQPKRPDPNMFGQVPSTKMTLPERVWAGALKRNNTTRLTERKHKGEFHYGLCNGTLISMLSLTNHRRSAII